jgi:hypothetical protein
MVALTLAVGSRRTISIRVIKALDNPMPWDRVVEKFHWLSEAFADEDLRNKVIQAVQQLVEYATPNNLLGLEKARTGASKLRSPRDQLLSNTTVESPKEDLWQLRKSE